MDLRDFEVLGKFWNDEGYYFVVYDEDIKFLKLFKISYFEWNFISVGGIY